MAASAGGCLSGSSATGVPDRKAASSGYCERYLRSIVWSLLVVLGGPMGVYERDRYPFIAAEPAAPEAFQQARGSQVRGRPRDPIVESALLTAGKEFLKFLACEPEFVADTFDGRTGLVLLAIRCKLQ